MTDNINKNKDQLDDSIYNELTFDTNSFCLSIGTKDPLPVVTVRIRGDNKHRATTDYGITFLWDSGATDSMINI